MRKHLALIGFLGLMLAAGHARAGAQVIEDAPIQPNQYEFAGRNLTIFYSTSSLTGEPMLTSQRGSYKPRHFEGGEIRVERTEISHLVTVTLMQIPDLKTITLTVMIPVINLHELEPVLFETTAVITIHHTTIAGSDLVEGPVQIYLTRWLRAQASHVDFFSMEGSGVIGKVIRSPTCPGPQRPGQFCVGPLPDASVQVRDDMDTVVATAITDDRGLFSIRAEPGDYTVKIDSAGVWPHCPETPITIPDRLVPMTINCDTGIR